MTSNEHLSSPAEILPKDTLVYFVAEAGDVRNMLIRGVVARHTFEHQQCLYSIGPEKGKVNIPAEFRPFVPTWENPLTANKLFMPAEVSHVIARLKHRKAVPTEKVSEYLVDNEFNSQVIEHLRVERQKRQLAATKG
jgi:hypothetical protein